MSKMRFLRLALVTGIVSVILLLSGSGLKAQIIHPMDKGVPDSVAAACTDTLGNYYVVHCVRDTSLNSFYGIRYPDTFRVSKWNGTFWSPYPIFNANAGVAISIIVYKNELYINYTYGKGKHVMRWHNNAWDTISKSLNGIVNNMLVYNNKLILQGNFTKAFGKTANKIASWDGSLWDTLAGGISNGKKFLSIGTSCIYKNRLVLGATVLDSAGHGHRVEEWNGKAWKELPFMGALKDSETVLQMAAANGNLYATRMYFDKKFNTYKRDTAFFEWNDTFWQKLQPATNINQYNYYNLGTYKTKLIIEGYSNTSGHFCKSWDGGSWTSMSKNINNISFPVFNKMVEYNGYLVVNEGMNISFWNGSTWAKLPVVGDKPGWFNSPGIFCLNADSKHLYIAGNFSLFQGMRMFNVGEFATKISSFSGKVYIDQNANCKYDSGDVAGKNTYVKISPNGYTTSTDSNGDYFLYSDTTGCTISSVLPKYCINSCPSTGSITFSLPHDSNVTKVDFTVQFNGKVSDLKMTLDCDRGFTFHPRVQQHFYLNYENIGTLIQSGKIYLTKPGRLINFKAYPVQDSLGSTTAIWSFKNLYPGDKRTIQFDLNADTALSQGDTLLFYTRFDEKTNSIDSDKSNNADTLVMISGNSHDPNNKQSYPFSDITTSTKEIRYHIEFQNTGTTEASQVVVIDTIDTSLPLTEVTMNSSSHKYRLDINNNVFRWTFENINLPDSTSDVRHSTGYISFTAKIKKGISVGTTIKNKAYIYFDYNPAMLTNQTLNKVGITYTALLENVSLSSNIKLYPNPANDELLVENRSPENRQFIIFNSVGQQVTQINIGKNQNETLNTSSYPAGIYYILGNKGESGKFIIQH